MILRGAKLISPADNLEEILDINIQDGIIIDLAKNIDSDGSKEFNYSGKTITPGLIDMHCHLREPGFEYKETIETGIKSALAGGFVGICPMANTNPVVDNIETLKFIIKQANDYIGPNFIYPICAVTKGLQGRELTDFVLLGERAFAFSDDGKPITNSEILKKALQTGKLIISHAEEETDCVKRELEILRAVGGRLHFAHISTNSAVDLIRNAKNAGLNVTCETAPHYFSFTKEDETSDGRFKMNPPLRTKKDLEAVIEGLKDGTIDCIATDHAPHSIEEKTKPFNESPFGIVGFETVLGAAITNLVYKEYISMHQLIEKMSVNPAKILNLENYGHIKIGQTANLTIIDTDTIYTVKENEFKSKCKISPFNGCKYKGRAVAAVVNGKLIETGASL